MVEFTPFTREYLDIPEVKEQVATLAEKIKEKDENMKLNRSTVLTDEGYVIEATGEDVSKELVQYRAEQAILTSKFLTDDIINTLTARENDAQADGGVFSINANMGAGKTTTLALVAHNLVAAGKHVDLVVPEYELGRYSGEGDIAPEDIRSKYLSQELTLSSGLDMNFPQVNSVHPVDMNETQEVFGGLIDNLQDPEGAEVMFIIETLLTFTPEQIEELVSTAKENGKVLVFDNLAMFASGGIAPNIQKSTELSDRIYRPASLDLFNTNGGFADGVMFFHSHQNRHENAMVVESVPPLHKAIVRGVRCGVFDVCSSNDPSGEILLWPTSVDTLMEVYQYMINTGNVQLDDLGQDLTGAVQQLGEQINATKAFYANLKQEGKLVDMPEVILGADHPLVRAA